ncbi:histidine--tRNA ligase [Agreia bicolorata]|uniref:Histidine--tRNA ligase n=1 Tax=Agreia bicolorata TaxID=110935 RepID=A0ABR5CJB4_9MICO|nr:histidine--tRNA ligase [Agreia bicolorata]KJC65742.1 histidyl-tRNA synthetase [Agreia bicolorata]
MASAVTPPRGMRDFLPGEKAKREHALGVIRRSYSAHGFDEIETPVMEDIQRLHSGLGGDNEKLSFSVLRRGIERSDLDAAAESNDAQALADLGLRFDLTVPLARFYATHRAELPAVFRSVQIAPVWRAERPQKGRYRQFMQCDIDIIGDASALAEVELISATLSTLDALGLQGSTVRINDRRLLIGMLELFGFPADQHDFVLIVIDKIDKIGTAGVIEELRSKTPQLAEATDALESFFLRPQDGAARPFGHDAIARALPEGVDSDVIAELASIGDAVDAGRIRFDPFLVRGMGYYTGTIFEIAHPDFAFSLGGGGRYDGMIGRFLGTDVPAVGFSIGFERIVDLVDLPDEQAADSVVVLHDAAAPAVLMQSLKTELIASGARVRLERKAKNAKLQLERLADAGFTRVATVLPDVESVADLKFRALGR